jgi:hydrogenase maturation factor
LATLKTGKLPPDLLDELLAEGPPLPPEVLLGPGLGEDACAIRLPAGTLIAATDPITLTGDAVGAHSVVVNANDVAVMGVRPRWFLAAVMLPEGSDEALVRALFTGMRGVLAELGVALVGGHTEVTAAVSQPLVVGQMLGHTESGRFVRTGGLRPGHVVLQVGPAPVEGAAVLAAETGWAAAAAANLPRGLLERARGALDDPGISVVEPALRAAELGASALHDPTEGGMASGLRELAVASGVGLEVAAEEVIWFEPGVAMCRALGADPWGTLASGSLLAGFPADRWEGALTTLRSEGWAAACIGRATPGSDVRFDGGAALPEFDRDEVARLAGTAAGGAT